MTAKRAGRGSRRRADAQLVAVLAARGMGKSAFLGQWMDAHPSDRIAIWDTKQEHNRPGFQTFTADQLPAFILALRAPRFSLRFLPDMDDSKRRAAQFDLFCFAVYLAKRCQCIVEELAFVTSPSRAPEGWRKLLMLGREVNPEGGDVTVVTTAQRPASVDKDLLGNATLIHAGRLPFENDAKLVARALGVKAADLMQLPKLHWLERGENDTAPRAGVITFSSPPRPVPKPPLERPPKDEKMPPGV